MKACGIILFQYASVADIGIKSYADIIIRIGFLSLREDMVIQLPAVGSRKVYDDIEMYCHFLLVKIEAVYLQHIFVRHYVPAYILIHL